MSDAIYDFYSVDASVMIKLKDMLPYDLFRPAWDEIGRLVSTNHWKIFECVADEIKGNTVERWLAENNSSIVKFNPEINEYLNILMADLQKNNMMLINPMNLKSKGDPFVIMLALYLEKRDLKNLKIKIGNETCCVLTNEEPRRNKINIPFVCEYYNIPFMNLSDFMRYHGWRISLDVQNP